MNSSSITVRFLHGPKWPYELVFRELVGSQRSTNKELKQLYCVRSQSKGAVHHITFVSTTLTYFIEKMADENMKLCSSHMFSIHLIGASKAAAWWAARKPLNMLTLDDREHSYWSIFIYAAPWKSIYTHWTFFTYHQNLKYCLFTNGCSMKYTLFTN